MNIYNAIMLAAGHIERNPGQFKFSATIVPDCGSPGCALGWIGHFAGIEPNSYGFDHVSRSILRCQEESLSGSFDGWATSEFAFYNRMTALVGHRWIRDAAVAAKGMRLYAEKYYGQNRPATRTDSELVAALLANIKAPVSEAMSEELTWA